VNSQGSDILKKFIEDWKKSFSPPPPVTGGKRKRRWDIPWQWSNYLSKWLWKNYHTWFEYSVNPEKNKTKLDAAIWLKKKGADGDMDLALEWEWNACKKNTKFPKGDFAKLLEVPAKAGLAIIHSKRTESAKKQTANAEKTLSEIKKFYKKNKPENGRPVGIIEIRRVINNKSRCEFKCFFHDLVAGKKEEEWEMATPLIYERDTK